jgi:two-component system KDP operon response regulator KdpE
MAMRSRRRPVPDGEDTPGAVLLLVEDEAPNRALLRAVLSRSRVAEVRDATLVEATDIAGARQTLASERVDVVLLDVRLPDGSGLDLARELRDRRGTDGPRILILSASVLPSERSAAHEAGADAFLAKPYDFDVLIATIRALIAGDSLPQEA